MLAWHAAVTQPFSEMVAEENLKRQGFQPFNPKCYSERITRGRRVLTERCYIPGYIFVRFDSVNDRWEAINSTRGIKSLMYAASEKPAPIREAVMQVLLDRCNGDVVKAEDLDLAISRVIPIGALVKVTEGPFEGFVGPVKWNHNERVKVMLSLFGRSNPVKLPTTHVALA